MEKKKRECVWSFAATSAGELMVSLHVFLSGGDSTSAFFGTGGSCMVSMFFRSVESIPWYVY